MKYLFYLLFVSQMYLFFIKNYAKEAMSALMFDVIKRMEIAIRMMPKNLRIM